MEDECMKAYLHGFPACCLLLAQFLFNIAGWVSAWVSSSICWNIVQLSLGISALSLPKPLMQTVLHLQADKWVGFNKYILRRPGKVIGSGLAGIFRQPSRFTAASQLFHRKTANTYCLAVPYF
jgi:hypothetical protein